MLSVPLCPGMSREQGDSGAALPDGSGTNLRILPIGGAVPVAEVRNQKPESTLFPGMGKEDDL